MDTGQRLSADPLPERVPGYAGRIRRLRAVLQLAAFTDEQQAAMHYLAYWLNDEDMEHVACLILAAGAGYPAGRSAT